MSRPAVSETLYALIDSQGQCKRTKFTKDMILREASIGDRVASYKLTKVESVGLADEPANEAPKAGAAE